MASLTDNLCLDDLQQSTEPFNLGVYSCHKAAVTRSQLFSFTNAGILRNELMCATVQKRYIIKLSSRIVSHVMYVCLMKN